MEKYIKSFYIMMGACIGCGIFTVGHLIYSLSEGRMTRSLVDMLWLIAMIIDAYYWYIQIQQYKR